MYSINWGLWIVCMIFVSRQLQLVSGCSCMPTSPHNKFCTGSFGIIAKVLKETLHKETFGTLNDIFTINTESWERVTGVTYLIEVLKDLRESDDVKLDRITTIKTAGDGAMCGVRLGVNQTYILAGYMFDNQLRIGLCDYIMKFNPSHLAFAQGYDCRCKIADSYYYGESKNEDNVCSLDYGGRLCLSGIPMCKSYAGGKCQWQCPN